MKNIAIIIPNLAGGGAERAMITLAEAFVQANVNCHIFTLEAICEYPINPQIPIHTLPRKIRDLNIPGISILPKSFQKKIIANRIDRFILEKMDNRVDLVLSVLTKCDKIMAFSSLNTYLVIQNTITLEHLHNLPPKKLSKKRKKLKNIYLRKKCIAISKGVENDFRSLFGKKSRIATIPNPIDLNQITQQGSQPIESLPPNFFLHIGRFEKQKRHDNLLKAYASSQVTTPLLLLGKGSLKDEIKELADQLNIAHLIHFVGFKNNPYPYLKQAKSFILSSDFEGLGMVLLESLALETPAISTDCPSGPNEILPPQNLCPVNDIEALGKLIQEADVNPNKFQAPVPKKFLTEHVTSQYLSLCETKES